MSESVITVKKQWHITTKTFIIFICCLSFTDALFTDIGIRLHIVEEWNPFANILYEKNTLIFYSYKTLLPLLLLALYPFLQSSTKLIDKLIVTTFSIYFFVNMYHLVWIGWFLI
ncbi:DUF5658 family protein [Evansella sp. AB-P1]|uniref:DUF5658 family protein n=1 Tax=Evansella sp. AB-P1 TaxID=3037653 RepID=UPI00241EE3BB|nr:DUF5658 family protein [Evansella sp. AB-P1]MDG5786732.1 DUF5658 family protein [Evansella sp. AB-P1]